MLKRRVSITFCGGCNPRIERGRIAAAVAEQLTQAGFVVVYNCIAVDYVVYLSGCSADCARRYCRQQLPHLAVRGLAVEALPVTAAGLVDKILDGVRDYFARLENNLPR